MSASVRPIAPPGTQLGLGDFLRAMVSLQPRDQGASAAIARLVGFEIYPQVDVVPLPDSPQPSIAPDDRVISRLVTAPRMSIPRNQNVDSAPARRLQPVDHMPLEAAGSDDALSGPSVATRPKDNNLGRPPEPLFNPDTVRSILFFALATVVHDGALDHEALTRYLTFQEEWRGHMPYLPRPTASFGVHIVFDRRPAMTPYYADQDTMLEIVRSVVGGSRTTFSYFRRAPDEIFAPGELFPKPGVPILLLSDLGIGQSPDRYRLPQYSWNAFFLKLRKMACPTVAFVPHAPDRWPPDFRRRIVIVQWDRSTTPSAVRRRVGIGHGNKKR
jgi:hypothetical protein